MRLFTVITHQLNQMWPVNTTIVWESLVMIVPFFSFDYYYKRSSSWYLDLCFIRRFMMAVSESYWALSGLTSIQELTHTHTQKQNHQRSFQYFQRIALHWTVASILWSAKPEAKLVRGYHHTFMFDTDSNWFQVHSLTGWYYVSYTAIFVSS